MCCLKYVVLNIIFVFIQASDEEHAYEIMKELDVDYVLVIFGGLIGYSSDGEIVFSFCLVKTKIYIINFFLQTLTSFYGWSGLAEVHPKEKTLKKMIITRHLENSGLIKMEAQLYLIA